MAMYVTQDLVYHVARQVIGEGDTVEPSPDPITPSGQCESGNEYDGRLGLRVSAIFVILIGSSLGAWFPVYASRHRGMGVPSWAFFVAKYFGSGVIVATAFIHLLAPANDALRDPCLTGAITEYPWVDGIALMTIFSLFFVELMTMRYAHFAPPTDEVGHDLASPHQTTDLNEATMLDEMEPAKRSDEFQPAKRPQVPFPRGRRTSAHIPGEDHLSHSRHHADSEYVSSEEQEHAHESYAAQMTAIFILEFGVIFHSIFIGLTLAVAGEEFETLYVVLVFHQTFEGLGLGSRLGVVPWPKSRKWTPYLMALAYGITTPIAIAIGLGVRGTYPPGSATTLIVNGVFDSISAGILIYTGLVELMAHEFMFSNVMRRARLQTVLSAFGLMCLGAGLMALLGKWA